ARCRARGRVDLRSPARAGLPGRRAHLSGLKILIEVNNLDRFENAGHRAAYAGLAPRTHRSGTSIKGEHQQRAGNKRLKKAMFRAAIGLNAVIAWTQRLSDTP